jgi:hypothetical protein
LSDRSGRGIKHFLKANEKAPARSLDETLRNVSHLHHPSFFLIAGGELRGGEPAGFPLAGTCTIPIVYWGGIAFAAKFFQ